MPSSQQDELISQTKQETLGLTSLLSRFSLNWEELTTLKTSITLFHLDKI